MADAALAHALRAAQLDWVVPAWDAPPQVHAFMTTRNAGEASGMAGAFDIGGAYARDGAGNSSDASDSGVAAVAANRQRIAQFLPAPPVWLEQVHGRDVVVVDARNAAALREKPARADALVTREADVALAIRAADCAPVLFASRTSRAIGAAHAGWRGLAAGVLEATLDAMDAPRDSVVAWLGPAISASAFEVGADVLAAFCAHDAGAAVHFRPTAPGKWHANLHALAMRRLRAAGVDDVSTDDGCTFGDPARFFSYRRDGNASGRMATLIWQRY